MFAATRLATSEEGDHHVPFVINCEFRLVPLLSVGHPKQIEFANSGLRSPSEAENHWLFSCAIAIAIQMKQSLIPPQSKARNFDRFWCRHDGEKPLQGNPNNCWWSPNS